MSTDALALQLDREGLVTTVVDGTALENTAAMAGRRFVDLCDESAADEARRFVDEVRAIGGAAEWWLDVPDGPARAQLCFYGALVGSGMLVIGVASSDGLVGLFSRLVQAHDERARIVSQLLRALLPRRGGRPPSSPWLEEISRMSSELATTQRILAQKCALLERENQVLGNAAHDLRSPLGVILGGVDMLLRVHRETLTSVQRHLLERIVSSGRFMAALIDELLDFSAIEGGFLRLDLTEFDLRDEILATVATSRPSAARKSILLEATCETPLWVRADRRRLRQLLNNLLDNAVKFSSAGTRVKVAAAAAGHQARVTITNRGPGIPPDALPTLFEPFQGHRTKGTAGEPTTGLGLAIVRQVTEAHGGRITVDSEPGRGASFCVELPLHG